MIASVVDAVVFFVSAVCQVFYWLLIVRVILSWAGVNPYLHMNELVGAVYQATDWILQPFRKLPLRVGMFDFSPLVVLYLLHILPGLVAALLTGLFRGFR